MRMLTFGRYEILECSNPYNSSDSVVQIIQGADVKVLNTDLQTHIHWKDNIINSSIDKVSFLIENKDHKLGDIFENSPYGIIKKNRTGIGATTLELVSKRNSIIVVTTKSLAYNKAKSRKDEQGNWSVLYVGSEVSGAINLPKIHEYLSNETIVHKKFLVVADSLYKVIDAIGDSVYESYFLMVDEIDSFQSDSTYRPRLENVIDYYLKFNPKKRCLVSATINEFSNKLIAAEPVINVIFNDQIQKNIDLIHTNNHNAVAVDKIRRLYAKSNDKIVVAYNKILNIRQIIEELGDEYKHDCEILCSSSSISSAGDYYGVLIDDSLTKRITFLTCSYFVGIDIKNRYHLIAISNTKHNYTLLSFERLIQIAGRCRDSLGLLSETIIFDSFEYDFPKTPEQYRSYALSMATDLKDYVNDMDVIINKFSDIIGSGFSTVKDDIIEKAKFRFPDNFTIPVLRENVNEEYVPAFFNIDAIYEFYKLRTDLYSNPEQLQEKLISEGHIVNFDAVYKEISEEQAEINQRIYAELSSNQEAELDKLIDILTELYYSDSLNNNEIRKLVKSTAFSFYCQKFIGRFYHLYKFIPFLQLIDKLKEISNQNEKAFRSFNYAAIFWALDNNHPFKSQIISEFHVGVQFTRAELIDKLRPIVKYLLQRNLNDAQLIHFIKQICNITRGNSKATTIFTINSENSFNPRCFEGEPVNVISNLIDNNELNSLLLFGE